MKIQVDARRFVRQADIPARKCGMCGKRRKLDYYHNPPACDECCRAVQK
jgi:hypothetical protein